MRLILSHTSPYARNIIRFNAPIHLANQNGCQRCFRASATKSTLVMKLLNSGQADLHWMPTHKGPGFAFVL